MTGVTMQRCRSLGVASGAAPLASADVLSKMALARSAQCGASSFDLIFESQPWRGPMPVGAVSPAFKIHLLDTIRAFEKRSADAIVMPCFLSHTFIDELKANASLPVADIMDALRSHVRRTFPSVTRIGVLTSGFIRSNGLFERYFDAPQFDVLHPRHEAGVDHVTRAVYGDAGIKQGRLRGRPVELLRAACADLVAQGAQIILPGLAEIGLVAHELGGFDAPLVDANQVYARYVVTGQYAALERRFKVGVVGGVGPAATVDFLAKLVSNTPAECDQDHLKIMVEQNPQIPDRTDYLLGDGDDPTLALYATCRTLEEGGADLIAIPCNTAHAFVEHIQPTLSVPIVNMLTCTVDYLHEHFSGLREIGVLATTGTLASGVYETALDTHGFRQVAPRPVAQARLMNAVYGPNGVKAGHLSGECVDDLDAALDDLIAQGVQVIVLGCTELPLLLQESTLTRAGRASVRLVDPTDVLAKRCVAYALGQPVATGSALLDRFGVERAWG